MALPFQQTFLRKGHPRKVIGLALTFSNLGDTEIVMSQHRFRRVNRLLPVWFHDVCARKIRTPSAIGRPVFEVIAQQMLAALSYPFNGLMADFFSVGPRRPSRHPCRFFWMAAFYPTRPHRS
jgi:hypothetical protein